MGFKGKSICLYLFNRYVEVYNR